MSMAEGVLGVIGGLGPLATAHFLELIDRMTDASAEQQKLDVNIFTVCFKFAAAAGFV